MAQHEVFEGVVDVIPHLQYTFIIRKHQRQFLLEHEHARRNRRHDIPAGIDHLHQGGNIHFLGFGNGFEITQLQLGHATATLLFGNGHGDTVVLENGHQILTDIRLIVVAVAGGKQGDFACRAASSFTCRIGLGADALAQGLAGVFWDHRIVIHTQGLFQQFAEALVTVHGIDHTGNDGNSCQPGHGIRGGQDLVADPGAMILEMHRLGLKHQVGEIQVPLVGRHIGAFGQEAQITQVTVIHDFPVIFLVHTIDFHGVGFVHQVKQGGKGMTEADAAAAPVTDIEHTFHFRQQFFFVIELRVFPVQGMPGRRLQAAFTFFAHYSVSSSKPGRKTGPGYCYFNQLSNASRAFWKRLA